MSRIDRAAFPAAVSVGSILIGGVIAYSRLTSTEGRSTALIAAALGLVVGVASAWVTIRYAIKSRERGQSTRLPAAPIVLVAGVALLIARLSDELFISLVCISFSFIACMTGYAALSIIREE